MSQLLLNATQRFSVSDSPSISASLHAQMAE